MSSDDIVDTATTALLQASQSDADRNDNRKDEEQIPLQEDSQTPKDDAVSSDAQGQDNSETAASPGEGESPAAELKLENEENPDESSKTDQIVATDNGSGAPPPPADRNKSSKSCCSQERAKKLRMATSLEDITSLRLWKGIIAEFVGTLLLTMIGCGSCVELNAEAKGTSPVVQIALCFGLSVATIVWAIGHVSGGHINPAVTVAMLATRKISLAKAAFFILFQLVGAVVGAGILFGLTPSGHRGTLGATLVSKHLTVGQAVGVEILITFVLVFTVFASVDNKRRDLNGSTPLTIGLSVTMCHLFAVNFTGSSMNTARSFGPALVIGLWDDHWVYWVGPILGGVLAGLLYENLFAVNASLEKAKACLLSSDYDDDRYQAQKMKIRILEEDPDEPPKEELPLSEKTEDVDSDPSNV